jgi:hypothetical protein
MSLGDWIKRIENILGVILGVLAALAWMLYGILVTAKHGLPIYLLWLIPGGLALAAIILAVKNGASASPEVSISKMMIGGKFKGVIDWVILFLAIPMVVSLIIVGIVAPPTYPPF